MALLYWCLYILLLLLKVTLLSRSSHRETRFKGRVAFPLKKWSSTSARQGKIKLFINKLSPCVAALFLYQFDLWCFLSPLKYKGRKTENFRLMRWMLSGWQNKNWTKFSMLSVFFYMSPFRKVYVAIYFFVNNNKYVNYACFYNEFNWNVTLDQTKWGKEKYFF